MQDDRHVPRGPRDRGRQAAQRDGEEAGRPLRRHGRPGDGLPAAHALGGDQLSLGLRPVSGLLCVVQRATTAGGKRRLCVGK